MVRLDLLILYTRKIFLLQKLYNIVYIILMQPYYNITLIFAYIITLHLRAILLMKLKNLLIFLRLS